MLHVFSRLLLLLTVSVFAGHSHKSQQVLQDTPVSADMVLISDVLARGEINVFSGFVRDDSPIARQLADQSVNATVLAPLNSAIAKLPHKPWENPEDYSNDGPNAYSGDDGAKRAQDNLHRFVAAHIVLKSPWDENDRIKSLSGKEIWWEKKGDNHVIQPDGVTVQRITNKVSNGEVWTIEGVLKP